MSFYILGEEKKPDNFRPVLFVNLDLKSIFSYCRVTYCSHPETVPEVCSNETYTQMTVEPYHKMILFHRGLLMLKN